MLKISETEFRKIVTEAIDAVPEPYAARLNNVAFIVEDLPSKSQRAKLGLGAHDLLFGLYEGVPLPQRQGATKLLPDKITIFKKPLEQVSHNPADLTERIRHTVWHEVAHYFGLDHDRIYELERRARQRLE